MKVCPHCGETYQDYIDFCFLDGEVLAMSAAGVGAGGLAPGADASVGPRRTAPASGAEPSAASMAATPVPRGPRRTFLPGKQGQQGNQGAYGAPTPVPSDNGAANGLNNELNAPELRDTRTPVPVDTDDDPEPPPQSLIETAPILRPQRPGTNPSTAPTPLSPPTHDERVPEVARDPAPRAPVTPPPVRQLVNTTPKAVAFAGEVVEPESSTMLFAGIGALAVGTTLIVLSIGAVFWASSMFGDDGAVADAGRVEQPVPAPPPPEPQPDPVQPATVEPGSVEPGSVQPGSVEEPGPAPAPAPTPDPDPVPAPDPAPGPRPAPQVVPGRPRPAPVEPAPAPVATEQRLKFVSSPPGAKVEVAGETHETPFDLVLGPGDHRWWAQQKNRKSKESSLRIETVTDDVRVVDVSLAPETRGCFLLGENDVAEIRFDSYVLQTIATVELPIGHHNVTATLNNGATARGTIDVAPPNVAPKCNVIVNLNTVSVP
jgi:hypothetical protein